MLDYMRLGGKNMKLEKFKSGELGEYIELATLFHNGPGSCTPPKIEVFKKNFDKCLESNEVHGFFITNNEIKVGYVLCSIMYTTEIGDYLNWIEEISVLDDHQGNGYGSAALDLIEKEFPQVKRIRLEVAPKNDAAKKLYQRYGYVFGPYEQMYKNINQ